MQASDWPHTTTDPADLGGAGVACIVLATSLAVVMLNVAPAAESHLRQWAHWSSGQVGVVFFVELAAMGLASTLAYAWLGRAHTPQVARFAYAVFILGSLISSGRSGSFGPYVAARAFTGAGAGTLMVLGMSLAARANSPVRLYAVITLAQLASGAALLALLSALDGGGRGLDSVFHISAGLGVLGFVAAGRLPRARTPESAQTHTGSLVGSALWRMTLLAVAFAMVFNVVVGGLWSFAAEYAGAGAAPAQVARVMAWATAAGLAGAASAFLIGSSRPRRHMLVLGYSGILLGAGLLQFARGPAGFAAGCGVLSLAWNFCVPYVFAAVAGQDPTGKLMPAANLAFALGLALGPLLAGAVIETSGIDALFPCALAALALGTVLTLRITRDSST